MLLPEKQKKISNFLIHFLNLYKILNILKEKMIVIANVFPKLQTVKNFVRTFSKKHCFRQCFDSEHVKASQILAKYPLEHFYQVFSYFSGILIQKVSPLVLGEILGEIVNTLTVDNKYPFQDFATPNSNAIIWKTKNFFWIFCFIYELSINF